MSHEHYAYDGVYMNVNTLKTDHELEVEEQKRKEASLFKGREINKKLVLANLLRTRPATKLEREYRLLYSLDDLKSNKSIRNLFAEDLLDHGIYNILSNYAGEEAIDFGLVLAATSRNGIIEITLSNLRSLKVNSDSVELKLKLKHFVKKQYNSKETAYERVNRVQRLIHELLKSNGLSIYLDGEDKNTIRELLSLYRIHFMYFDFITYGFEKVLNEHFIYKEMRSVNEKMIESHIYYNFVDLNYAYVENWRRNHFKSLLDYFSYNRSISNLLSIDTRLTKDDFIEQCFHAIDGTVLSRGLTSYYETENEEQESAFIHLVNNIS